MKFGFIGNGNMGRTIICGILDKGIVEAQDVIVSDMDEAGLEWIKSKYGVSTTTDNKITAGQADILFLCVKPQFLYFVIKEIKNVVSENTVIVSIAAGQSIEAITEAFDRKIKLVRVMPNTPALVGEGMAAIAPNENISDSENQTVFDVFSSLGKAAVVHENLMDAVTAVSGSSPAYVFMFIEAMADAAVIGGMSRSQAYIFAAQAVIGSAKMVLETRKHPGELKDMVCSPAGTTIDAVAALEKNGFRNAVIEAMISCMNKSKELGNK